METSTTRTDLIKDKAIVFAIANWQRDDLERQPVGDMLDLCKIMRSECSPEYLALLVQNIYGATGLHADIYLDFDGEVASRLELLQEQQYIEALAAGPADLAARSIARAANRMTEVASVLSSEIAH